MTDAGADAGAVGGMAVAYRQQMVEGGGSGQQ